MLQNTDPVMSRLILRTLLALAAIVAALLILLAIWHEHSSPPANRNWRWISFDERGDPNAGIDLNSIVATGDQREFVWIVTHPVPDNWNQRSILFQTKVRCSDYHYRDVELLTFQEERARGVGKRPEALAGFTDDWLSPPNDGTVRAAAFRHACGK